MISKKKRAVTYALCAVILFIIPCNFSGFEVEEIILKTLLILFLGIKSRILFLHIRLGKSLKEAADKTEFIHDLKLYKIDNAKVIKKIEYPYRPAVDLAKAVFFDARIKSKLRTVLYQSQKENYFMYTIYINNGNDNVEIRIDPLSTEQTKDWLYHTDIEIFKQIFGEFDEA